MRKRRKDAKVLLDSRLRGNDEGGYSLCERVTASDSLVICRKCYSWYPKPY